MRTHTLLTLLTTILVMLPYTTEAVERKAQPRETNTWTGPQGNKLSLNMFGGEINCARAPQGANVWMAPHNATNVPRNTLIWLTLYNKKSTAPRGWLEDKDGNQVSLRVSGKEVFMYQPNELLKANTTYTFRCQSCFTSNGEQCQSCPHDKTTFTTGRQLETSSPTYKASYKVTYRRIFSDDPCDGLEYGTHRLELTQPSNPNIAWYELTKLTKDGKDHSETYTRGTPNISLSLKPNRAGERVCYQLDAISYTGKVISGTEPICQTLDGIPGLGCNQTQGISKNPSSLLWSLLVFAFLFGFRHKRK